MATNPNVKQESTVGTILGWGGLALFSIAFAWHVGAQLIMRERWADKCRFNLLARIGSANWRLVGTGVWKYALAEEVVGTVLADNLRRFATAPDR